MVELPPEVHRLIDSALSEDQAFNDPTTQTLIPPEIRGQGMLRAKAHGVVAGLHVAMEVFRRVDQELQTHVLLEDGSTVSPGMELASVKGSAASILKAERVSLNFLQRMSGIASDTNRYVLEVRTVPGVKSRIVDTRKTAPGHRYLDKYAVRMGGGSNHRLNLADGILIKDNHIQALQSQEMGLNEVIQLALTRAPHTIRVEVEVETLDEVRQAVDAGAHIIMLDNMPVDMMRQAVAIIDGRAVIEASGGIDHDTVQAVAATGVDLISVGALTHSTIALDISLDLEFD